MSLLQKKENKKFSKSQLLVIGSFIFILIGTLMIVLKTTDNVVEEKKEQEKIDSFIKESKNKEKKVYKLTEKKKETPNYLGVLEIPKIDLRKGFFAYGTTENNVEKNIEVVEYSNMPDVENGNLIIASHSGNSEVSFFKDLHLLKTGDNAIVYYKGIKYKYELVTRYEIEKTGKAKISRNGDKKVLTLITCKPNTKKQYVLVFEEK